MLLLANSFEEFRGVCMWKYSLDQEHYVSSTQVSWDAVFRHRNTTLDLISDPEMFCMVDFGIRCGVARM